VHHRISRVATAPLIQGDVKLDRRLRGVLVRELKVGLRMDAGGISSVVSGEKNR